MAMTVSSSFTAFALPATCNGTMPNDIEIKNGDGTDIVQTTLGEAFGTAFMDEEGIDEWYWVDYKASEGGGMDSYLYQLGLVTDTGDGGMSGMSTWIYRVSNESAGATTQVTVPTASWAQDSKGWWIQYADGSYLTNAWYQNTDGAWYYMGVDGYMLTNTTTPDGYKVDADGAWIQ